MRQSISHFYYHTHHTDLVIYIRRQPFKKVFETVKCAARSTAQGLEKAGRGAMCGTTGSTAGPVASAWSGGGVGGWPGTTGAWPGPSSGPRMSICSSSDSAMDNNSVTSSYGEQDRDDIYPWVYTNFALSLIHIQSSTFLNLSLLIWPMLWNILNYDENSLKCLVKYGMNYVFQFCFVCTYLHNHVYFYIHGA